mmetsp:Transcript_9817/g.20906  ORF Transcript_9817/g.20906 Transcript_9817/m.20906 type:complete len:153 (-) Transcript_9817:901-1359(-)
MKTKTEKMASLKKRFSDDINELKSKVYETKRDSKDLKRMKVANESLAKNRLEKLRNLKSLLSELKLELDNESAMQAEVEEELSDLQGNSHQVVEKVWKQNDNKKGGHSVWEEWVVQMILEMLSDRTPPTCILANILTAILREKLGDIPPPPN